MAVTVVCTEGFAVKLVGVSEHSSVAAIAEAFDIPHQRLMALQRNNRALRHTVVLERFCGTTDCSQTPLLHNAILGQQDARDGPCMTVPLPSTLKCSPPCVRSWQAHRQAFRAAGASRPVQRLLCPTTASEPAACHPDDDLALKLFWGRQRGLAVIFAADAEQWAQRTQERWFLGDDCQLDASALDDPAQQAEEGAASLGSAMPPQQAHGDIGLLKPQHSDMGSKDDGELCKKLAIPDDACSVDGPPTPDNEDGHRVGMPAIHRSNEATSPGTVAAAARVLHLL